MTSLTVPGQPEQAMAAARGWLRRREGRVTLLVALVLTMSLIDLVVTLNYVTTVGMAEANPLARLVMSYNCPWLLATWKILLCGITGGLLIATRGHRSSEVGAWVCLGVMIWLMVRWQAYAETAHTMSEYQRGPEYANVEFVRIGGE